MKVVFFPEGRYELPASRLRAYFFANELEKNGIRTKIVRSPYLLYSSYLKRRILDIINIIGKFLAMGLMKKEDIMYIQRGIHRTGIFYLLWFFKRVLNRKMIFDFDDTIYLYAKRTKDIVRMSDIVIVGSHYLLNYSKKYNKLVFRIPTSTDTKKNKIAITKNKSKTIIGWIGSPTNLKYLKLLIEPLEKLSLKYNIEFRIIGANRFEDQIPKFDKVEFKVIPWSLDTEWIELSKFDIGVLPLYDTEWERGKCGYKAIQYMTVGIPAVCSAVGENHYIINDSINGFLCKNSNEWIIVLSRLIEDMALRTKIGMEGRKTVEEHFSLEANGRKLATIIKMAFGSE